MTDENIDFEELGRDFFRTQLAARAEAAPEEPDEPWSDADLDVAWTADCSPEELKRAARDGLYGQQLYERWEARQRAEAPIIAQEPEADPGVTRGVRAFEAGAAKLRDLSRADQQAVLDRLIGPPPTAALAAFESGDRGVALSANEQIEAVDRAFRRRVARERAERDIW